MPSFQRDVLPIMRTACAGCHGGAAPAAGLSLTNHAGVMKGGVRGVAVRPRRAAESLLYRTLTGAAQPAMPPGGRLRASDIEKIRRWIDAGALDDLPRIATSRAPAPAAEPVRAVSSNTGLTAPVRAPVARLRFSPDGAVLAMGGYGQVLLLEAATLKLLAVWTGHAESVRGLAFRRDGKLLAAGSGHAGADGQVRLWDVEKGRQVAQFGDHSDSVTAVAWSPDGARLATASADRSAKIWEAETGKLLHTLQEHSDIVWGLAWSPDGRFVATASADKSVKVWDAATGKRRYSLQAHDEAVQDVDFSPDGARLVTAGADRLAKLWNFGPDGAPHAGNLGGHGGPVNQVCFSADGQRIATASADRTVRLWHSGGGHLRTLDGAADWVYAVALSPDGRLAAGGCWDGSIRLWLTADGKLAAEWNPAARSKPAQASPSTPARE